VEIRDMLVLVTGASRGIGLATAEAFGAAGARLVLVARESDALHAAAERLGAQALGADLTDPAAVDGLVERAGAVDILVNNAGMDITKPLWEHSADELRRVMQLNLVTAMELTRQALPGMIARRRGHIVNISSLSGVVSLPGFTSYGASKAGLTHFTSCLHADLRGIKGVGVTVAEVGPVRSALLDSVTGADTIRRSYGRLYRTGMVRAIDPEDVARGVLRAVERGKRNVWLPRTSALAPAMAEVPRRVVGLITAGIRHPTPPG
jgi:short-subunit dehydrogenase